MAVVLALVGGVLLSVAVLGQDEAPPAPQSSPPRATSGPPSSPAGPSGAAGPRGATYFRPVGDVLARSAPVRIRIPAIGVSSPLERLGLQRDGTMAVPRDEDKAGWFTESPTPGSLGPAVIAGHVTWDQRPTVFYRLGAMRRGQRIEVDRADGSTAVFTVTKVARYAKADFPTEEVYGSVDHAAIRLITCGGVFDGENNRYLDNVIAFGKLTSARRG